jgi:pimeloyl-ACP methyl ester carboxylesterase
MDFNTLIAPLRQLTRIKMSKIPVYFMPGMAASSTIFERIKLPEDAFEIYLLEWILPEKEETLVNYAKRMSVNVKHENAVLIGVSFGGILVQEMKQFLNVRKVIIVSSVKSNMELPRKMKIAKSTKAYKLIPTTLLLNVENLAKYAFGSYVKQRLKLYEKFLSVRDKDYLDWSIEQIINWERTEIDPAIVHIHGDADEVFLFKYIKKCIVVKDGTHIMILNKYRWFNANLPEIILE